MPETKTIRIGDMDVDIEPVKPLSGGGARVDVSTDDGRTWRVDLDESGDRDGIVTMFRDDDLANLGEPEWLDDALSYVRKPA